MRPALRLTFVALFISGMTLGAVNGVGAQNTDEAHAECAQGGGTAPFSGAGEPNTRGISLDTARLAHFGASIPGPQDREAIAASSGLRAVWRCPRSSYLPRGTACTAPNAYIWAMRSISFALSSVTITTREFVAR